MTDYNDGKWHGWNNDGPCPVHPKSFIKVVYFDYLIPQSGVDHAGSWGWQDDDCPIVAFRVLKVYQWSTWLSTKANNPCKCGL